MEESKIWMGDEAKNVPVSQDSFVKAEPMDRLWAYLIDLGVILVGSLLCCLPGLAYGFLKDSLYDGRSIGKKVMGLQVLNSESLTPCKMMESVIRACSLAIPLFGIYDGLLVFIDPEGLRYGDRWAKTMVVKSK